MSFFENTRKPEGFGGKIMVAMMNVGHSAVARWGLQFLNAAPDAKGLDCFFVHVFGGDSFARKKIGRAHV